MVMTPRRRVLKSRQLRLFCRVWKMLTCSSRDSSTIMAAV
jgi:hypothetical protein